MLKSYKWEKVMMKLTNKLLFLSALLATSLTACNHAEPEPEPDNTHVDVFVLSGQSNMEGSTYYVHPNGTELLKNYFEEEGMDYTGVSEGISTVPELVDKINTIFHGDSDDAIQLSTVHKAKGLEADNVYILMPSLMPIKYATQDWEKTTEKNLIYVAITRAKKSLNYIEEENKTFGIAPSNIFDFDSMKKMVTLVKNKLHANDNIGIKEIKDNYHITYDERLNKIKNLGEKKETNNINDKKKNKKAAMRMQKFLE